MKKKILSLLAASALAVTAVQPVIARQATLSDLMASAINKGVFTTTVDVDGYGYNETTKLFDVEVSSDIAVRKSGSGTWSYGHDEESDPLKTTASSLTSTDAKFDFKATVDMSNVRAAFADFYNKAKAVTTAAGLQTEFDSLKLNGEFVINIETSGLSVPDAFAKSTSLAYFSDATKKSGIYTETKDRTKTSNKITITVDVVDVDADEIAADLNNKLCDLELECDKVEVNKYNSTSYAEGTFGVQVDFDKANTDDAYMNGYTTVSYKADGANDYSDLATFDYASNSDIAYVKVTKKSSGGGSSGGNGGGTSLPVSTSTNTLQFVTPYGTVTAQTSNNSFVVKGSELPAPAATEQSAGMIFDGWYYDPALTQPVQADDEVDVSGTTALYAKWLNINVPSALHNTIDDSTHYAYVIGYPDGTVQPEGNITRAEVATIFYRLLNDEKRASIKTSTSTFSDVSANDWFGTYIATMANGDYVHGYEDGTFRPDAPITRAEFATMAVAFAEQVTTPTATFTDIAGHWAQDYILKGAALGWINGYEDNTFRPDQYITRAEAMKLYNSVLNRHVQEDGFLTSAILWPDNSTSEWYYYEVEEATNSHDYQRHSEGYYESWTKIIPNKTWD